MTGTRDLDGATVLVRIATGTGISAHAADQICSVSGHGAHIAVLAGFADPAGDVNPALSLRTLAGALETATGMPVAFVPDCVGPVAEASLAAVPVDTIALLENLPFHSHAERQAQTFAIRLRVLGDDFTAVCDAPDLAPVWMRELATLLPQPAAPLSLAQTA